MVVETSSSSPRGSQNDERTSSSIFKNLFRSSETPSVAAKVIQSKNSFGRKLAWASIDKKKFHRLINDISRLIQCLKDALNISIQAQMRTLADTLLQEATSRSDSLSDLRVLKQLISDEPKDSDWSYTTTLNESLREKYNSLLCSAIDDKNSNRSTSSLTKRRSKFRGLYAVSICCSARRCGRCEAPASKRGGPVD